MSLQQPVICPKCARELQVGENACRSCGLRRANFAAFRTSGAGRTAGVVTQALWQEVEQDWSNPGAHEKFLAAAGRKGSFASAASLYRFACRRRQGDPLPARQLERINRTVLALHQATAVAAPARQTGDRKFRGLATLLLVLVLGGAGLAIAGSKQASPSSSAAPGEIVSPRSPRRHQPVLTPVARTGSAGSFWERTP
jgi:hypothetical protein